MPPKNQSRGTSLDLAPQSSPRKRGRPKKNSVESPVVASPRSSPRLNKRRPVYDNGEASDTDTSSDDEVFSDSDSNTYEDDMVDSIAQSIVFDSSRGGAHEHDQPARPKRSTRTSSNNITSQRSKRHVAPACPTNMQQHLSHNQNIAFSTPRTRARASEPLRKRQSPRTGPISVESPRQTASPKRKKDEEAAISPKQQQNHRASSPRSAKSDKSAAATSGKKDIAVEYFENLRYLSHVLDRPVHENPCDFLRRRVRWPETAFRSLESTRRNNANTLLTADPNIISTYAMHKSVRDRSCISSSTNMTEDEEFLMQSIRCVHCTMFDRLGPKVVSVTQTDEPIPTEILEANPGKVPLFEFQYFLSALWSLADIPHNTILASYSCRFKRNTIHTSDFVCRSLKSIPDYHLSYVLDDLSQAAEFEANGVLCEARFGYIDCEHPIFCIIENDSQRASMRTHSALTKTGDEMVQGFKRETDTDKTRQRTQFMLHPCELKQGALEYEIGSGRKKNKVVLETLSPYVPLHKQLSNMHVPDFYDGMLPRRHKDKEQQQLSSWTRMLRHAPRVHSLRFSAKPDDGGAASAFLRSLYDSPLQHSMDVLTRPALVLSLLIYKPKLREFMVQQTRKLVLKDEDRDNDGESKSDSDVKFPSPVPPEWFSESFAAYPAVYPDHMDQVMDILDEEISCMERNGPYFMETMFPTPQCRMDIVFRVLTRLRGFY